MRDTPRRIQAGFTLLELLVVLLILGILINFAVIGAGGGHGPVLKQEAQRIQALVRLARDEALLNAETMALGFTRGGYAFLQQVLVADATLEWRPIEDDPQFRARRLDDQGIELELDIGGRQEALVSADAVPPPQIFFLGSGQITAFQLRLMPSDADEPGLLLAASADGQLRLETL